MNKIFLIQFLLIFSAFGFIWELEPGKIQRQTAKGNKILVLYYIPQSNVYRDLIQEYKLIDKKVTDLHVSNFIVGKLDCEEFEDYCDELGITNFPTIRIVSQDSFIEVEGYEVNSIVKKLQSININIDEIKPTNIITITSDNFNLLKEKPIILKMYAPWCGACREFKPIYDNISREPKLTMAEINCDIEKTKCSEIGYVNYPTLLYIDKDIDKAVKYKGPKTEFDVNNWIDNIMKGIITDGRPKEPEEEL